MYAAMKMQFLDLKVIIEQREINRCINCCSFRQSFDLAAQLSVAGRS